MKRLFISLLLPLAMLVPAAGARANDAGVRAAIVDRDRAVVIAGDDYQLATIRYDAAARKNTNDAGVARWRAAAVAHRPVALRAAAAYTRYRGAISGLHASSTPVARGYARLLRGVQTEARALSTVAAADLNLSRAIRAPSATSAPPHAREFYRRFQADAHRANQLFIQVERSAAQTSRLLGVSVSTILR